MDEGDGAGEGGGDDEPGPGELDPGGSGEDEVGAGDEVPGVGLVLPERVGSGERVGRGDLLVRPGPVPLTGGSGAGTRPAFRRLPAGPRGPGCPPPTVSPGRPPLCGECRVIVTAEAMM